MELDKAPFDIETMVTDVINLMDNNATSKDIKLKANFNPNLQKTAIGDVGRIRQVLTNIVGNAVKFTHEGSVVLDVRGKSLGEQYKLSISITDTGIGIPPEKLDLVFQKFTQAESSTTRDYGGTGLGLAISRSLVEMMNGQIGVRSEIGKGSTFWFDILLDAHVQEAPSETNAEPGDIRLLIISHNPKNRKVLQQQFASMGQSVTVHESGTDALKCLQETPGGKAIRPLFIVEDNKAGIDALSLLDRFKNTPVSSGAPAIVLRTDNNASKTARFEQHDHVRLLSPPLSTHGLISAVNQSLADIESRTLSHLANELRLTAPTPGRQTAEKFSPHDVTQGALESAPQVDTPLTKPAEVKPRILIAEDNQINRIVIENMLDHDIYDVCFKDDGKAAVEAHIAKPFDLILMDISMPIMNGTEATLAIRALEKRNGLAAVPIVAVTAHDDIVASPSDNNVFIGIQRWIGVIIVYSVAFRITGIVHINDVIIVRAFDNVFGKRHTRCRGRRVCNISA